jgi:CP family cyanate transporter-like MFS transporter
VPGPTEFSWDRFTVGLTWSYCLLVSGLSVGVVLGELREELGLSGVVAALHGSWFGIFLIVLGAVALPAVRRVGRERAFWGSMAAITLGVAVLCAGRSWPVTLTGTAIAGAACALLVFLMPGIVADHHGSGRATAFAAINAWPGLAGITISLVIGGVLAAAWSWRLPYLAIAIAFAAAVFVTLRREPFPIESLAVESLAVESLAVESLAVESLAVESLAVESLAEAERGSPSDDAPAALGLLRRREVFVPWAATVLAVMSEFPIGIWLVVYLKEVGGATSGIAAMLGSVWGLSLFASRLAMPRLVRVAGDASRAVCYGLVLVGAVVLWVGPTLPIRTAGAALAAFGCGPLYPLSIDRLYARSGADTVALGAIGALASGVGVTTGPLLVGVLADVVGLRHAILVAAGLAFAGIVTTWPRSTPPRLETGISSPLGGAPRSIERAADCGGDPRPVRGRAG